ncbi:uncharacterized protein LOC133825594 [Humulus lupulus]|uniref:uncharacterized protein LOC133825594 n=1 Tax=Humulus lupulus TaxID=3486 RepID=UPI002B410C9B|nr:uncharacterized protein LOC133825594 [Humulus lupulus]
MLRWKLPPTGMIKVNMDAGVDKTQCKVGPGVVFRDDVGVAVASSSTPISACFDSRVAKAAALLEVNYCPRITNGTKHTLAKLAISMEGTTVWCRVMDMFREGGSTTRPPMLEGANYPYWKTKMRAYLKSVDERVWMAVSEGWTPPTEIVGNVDIAKAASKWTTDEIENANFNSKALNAIFNAVSANQMKVVANCEIAKEAWDKLKIKNEGTSAVKKSRLRSLAREFENLTMDEEDSIADFHAKLCDISNESYALGETYTNDKLVRKVLGSLPRRFKAKLTSIEEVHDVEDMDLDELIGSLQNYELTLKRWSKGKKVKDKETEKAGGSLAFVLKETHDQEGDMFDTLTEEKAECANTQKKKKKALVTTWSDSEEEKDGSCSEFLDHEKNVITFLAKEEEVENEVRDNESSCSEADSLDQQTAYEQMYQQWLTMVQKVKLLEERNTSLNMTNSKLEAEIKHLTEELEKNEEKLYVVQADLVRAKQSLESIPPGTAALNHQLHLQKPYGEMTSIGYKLLYKKGDNLTIGESLGSSAADKTHTIIDDSGRSQVSTSRSPLAERKEYKEVWRPKLTSYSQEDKVIFVLVAHTSLSAFKDDQWYFDSGCSKHMIGNKQLLNNYKEGTEGLVTFGDGNKGAILGRGDLVLKNLPVVKDVLYVKGLKANLLSISQLCDDHYTVNFSKSTCLVKSTDGCSVLSGTRSNDNCYMLNNTDVCSRVSLDKSDLWHYRLGHLNYRDLRKLVKLKAVRGVPDFKVSRERVCGPCQQGKQVRSSHSPIKMLLTNRALELLHIDLMGPMQTESLNGKRYVMNEKVLKITKVFRLRSDHGKEFENALFAEFCDHMGIAHEFSAPKTPQQNGVVERKNRTLQEMVRVMLNAKGISQRFWAEAINTACYISNRVHLRTGTTQTTYELWEGKTPNLNYLKIFGCTCYILNDRDYLGKFDSKSDKGMFLGYSPNSRAYRVFNKRNNTVMESVNVRFDDTEDLSDDLDNDEDGSISALVPHSQVLMPNISSSPSSSSSTDHTEPSGESEDMVVDSPESEQSVESSHQLSPARLYKKGPPSWIQKAHPPTVVIGDPSASMVTRRKVANEISHLCYLSNIEPKNVKQALSDEHWVAAMHEELLQFERNEVWDLVDRPEGKNIVGTKWILKNKLDEFGTVTRNKARLVAQGYK